MLTFLTGKYRLTPSSFINLEGFLLNHENGNAPLIQLTTFCGLPWRKA